MSDNSPKSPTAGSDQPSGGTSDAAPSGSPSDRREFPRYEVTANVDYTGSEVLLYHQIENISLGGVCIQTSSVEAVGTIVELVINFPDFDASISVQGEIVWANRDEPMDIGIRYIDVDDERKELMRKYINAVKRKGV